MKRSMEVGMTIRSSTSHDGRMEGGHTMKWLAVLFTVCLMAAFGTTAMAGDYHVGGTLVCSDCHVAHYSQSHGYESPTGLFTPLGADGPYTHLLRNEPNELCLTCHDGQGFAPDACCGLHTPVDATIASRTSVWARARARSVTLSLG